MPPKIPAIADISKIVVDHDERIAELKKRVDLDHERTNVLEKHASNMSGLPGTVAALGQQVRDLDKTMIREVDGLREQQKAHKTETMETISKGFESIGEKVDKVAARVDGVERQSAVQSAKQSGWWDVIEVTGKILLGLAVIGEFLKALLFH